MIKFNKRHGQARTFYRVLACMLLIVLSVYGVGLAKDFIDADGLGNVLIIEASFVCLAIIVCLQLVFLGRAPQWLIPTDSQ